MRQSNPDADYDQEAKDAKLDQEIIRREKERLEHE